VTLHVTPDGYLLGAGEGEALWFADSLLTYKTTGDQTSGRLAVAEVTAAKGAGSPSHRHQHEDEAWYVLDGQLGFWLGDDQFTAPSGAFVFGRRGIQHRFEVTSSEARFLLLLTPAGFEDFTRTCGAQATTLTAPPPELPQQDPDVLAAAARNHGLTIVDNAQVTTGKRTNP
jgi:quercetin dioxygenase-like cupin family protein